MLCTQHALWSYYGIQVQSGSLQHSDWLAGLTDRSRGVYHSTPGGSSESINGEDGQGNGHYDETEV